MKKVSVFLVILVGALLIGACSTAATSDDELSDTVAQLQEELNRLSDDLATAQSPQEVEVTSVVEVTAEEPAEVVVPATPVPPPTAAPVERNRVILFPNYSVGAERIRFTQLDALALENGIDLTTFPGNEREAFNVALDQPDVKLLVYMGIASVDTREVEADLLEIADFVEGGGRVLLLTQSWWSRSNELLKRLYGVSIVQESVVDSDQTFFFNNESLPHYMGGLEVGYAMVQMNHYLATSLEGGELRYLRSDATGDVRLWYISTPDRSLTVMAGIVWPSSNLFDDLAIDFRNNEQAALNMLNYLLGN